MTLAEIDTTISALELALATGNETVRFGDRTVTYRNPKEIMDAIEYFRARRRDLTDTKKQRGFSVVRFSA